MPNHHRGVTRTSQGMSGEEGTELHCHTVRLGVVSQRRDEFARRHGAGRRRPSGGPLDDEVQEGAENEPGNIAHGGRTVRSGYQHRRERAARLARRQRLATGPRAGEILALPVSVPGVGRP